VPGRLGAKGLPDLVKRLLQGVALFRSRGRGFTLGEGKRFLLPAFLPEHLKHQIGDEQEEPEYVFEIHVFGCGQMDVEGNVRRRGGNEKPAPS